MHNCAIVILAAGNSSRLGSIKQLLSYNSQTLLEHVIDEAAKAQLNPIVVVTGAFENDVSKVINRQKAQIVFNDRWQEGMASGIVAGISKVQLMDKDIENIIIAVCDQPFVTAVLFRQLIFKRKESGKNIIACSYAGTIGTPVLFNKKYFKKLLVLKGEEGAKKILRFCADDIGVVAFPLGNIDIDTDEDYKKLIFLKYQ